MNYPFKNRVNKKLSAGPQQIKVALIRNYDLGDTFLLWGEDASISVSQVSAQLSLSQTSACSPLCRWRCRNHLYPEDDEPCVPTLINSALFLTHLVSKTDSSSNESIHLSWQCTGDGADQSTHTCLIHQYSELSPPSGCAPCFSSSLPYLSETYILLSLSLLWPWSRYVELLWTKLWFLILK